MSDSDFGLALLGALPQPKATAVGAPTPQVPVPLYTPAAMVELMVAQPEWKHKQFADHFGRPLSWFSAVLASEAFQQALAPRKAEILDPTLTATMEERFRALALQSLQVLGEKLEGAEVSEFLATKATEIGVKALGLGNVALPAPVAVVSGAEAVAERIMEAMEKAKARSKAEAVDVTVREVPSGS